jgi:chromosome segregation ATPase
MTQPIPERPEGISTLGWLQDELHTVKAQIAKIQHQMDQTQALALDTADKVRQGEAGLEALAGKMANTSQFQEDIRQINDVTARLQEQLAQGRSQVEEVVRQALSAGERERVERSDLLQRLVELEREVETWREQQSSADQAARHAQEGVTLVTMRQENAEHRLEGAEEKAARSVEATNRIDNEFSKVEAILQELRREDEVQAERARVALEAARRLEGKVDSQRGLREALNQLEEKVELLRAERQRLEDRGSRHEEALEEQRSELERQGQMLSILDGRTQALQARLDALREDIHTSRQQITDHLKTLSYGQERVKRRQIDQLEHEIRELRQHAIDISEE